MVPFNECGICASATSDVRMVKLSSVERKKSKLLVLLLRKYGSNFSILISNPRDSCTKCFNILYDFSIILSNKIKRLQTLNAASMERKFPEIDETPEDSEKTQPKKEELSHGFRCSCQSCRNKYGDLPLLVECIEQKSPSLLDQKSSKNLPSTSQQRVPKKQMQCAHCKKSFTHRGDLNKHLRTHTKEQPFSCSICQRKFAHTSNLRRHLRVHSGTKPFVCNICERSFNRKDKLESHKNSKFCKKR